ncbi:hypothetical protein HDU76_006209 [Blyttiomyces sp. JEL0837]|nr:hypothetical protein HDU76_006209 [Blyttiomyces sp. JEL0837]
MISSPHDDASRLAVRTTALPASTSTSPTTTTTPSAGQQPISNSFSGTNVANPLGEDRYELPISRKLATELRDSLHVSTQLRSQILAIEGKPSPSEEELALAASMMQEFTRMALRENLIVDQLEIFNARFEERERVRRAAEESEAATAMKEQNEKIAAEEACGGENLETNAALENNCSAQTLVAGDAYEHGRKGEGEQQGWKFIGMGDEGARQRRPWDPDRVEYKDKSLEDLMF